MTYLLDTSVFSQPLRRHAHQGALARWSEAGDHACRVSVVSVAEVEWGLHLENREARWHRYRALLENRLTVLPADSDVWRAFSEMKARQQRRGEIVADLDLLIAATARWHGLTVATLNKKDFSRIEGIAWEDWSDVSAKK